MNSLFFITGFVSLNNIYGKLFNEDIKIQKELWETYKTDYKRTYADETEDNTRFGYFLKNLELADCHEQLAIDSQTEDHARHSITEFFDMNLVCIYIRYIRYLKVNLFPYVYIYLYLYISLYIYIYIYIYLMLSMYSLKIMLLYGLP